VEKHALENIENLKCGTLFMHQEERFVRVPTYGSISSRAWQGDSPAPTLQANTIGMSSHNKNVVCIRVQGEHQGFGALGLLIFQQHKRFPHGFPGQGSMGLRARSPFSLSKNKKIRHLPPLPTSTSLQ